MLSYFNFLKLRRSDSLLLGMYLTYLPVGEDFKLCQPPTESVLLGRSPFYYYYYRGRQMEGLNREPKCCLILIFKN